MKTHTPKYGGSFHFGAALGLNPAIPLRLDHVTSEGALEDSDDIEND